MRNYLVILLLSLVVLLIALYGYTVEQKIKKEIKGEIKEEIEVEFAKMVNAELEHEKEMKKIKGEIKKEIEVEFAKMVNADIEHKKEMKKIKGEIKEEIEVEFAKMVNAKIEHQKEMKKIKEELEHIKSKMQEKDKYDYGNEIYLIQENVTALLKDKAFNDFEKGAKTSCDIGWVLENKSCYYFSRFATNFYTALSFCKTIGGKLIEIDDQSEWDMIKRHVLGRRFPDFYIGLTDLFSEGDWQKATTLGRQNFLQWGNGQPDNAANNQHCVQVWASSITFDDLGCHVNRHFICEK